MTTTTTSNPRPVIFDDGVSDLLETFDTVRLTSRQLREGMILVDELGCPIYLLDHRIGAVKGGNVEWMVHDLERGGLRYECFSTTLNATIPVGAR
jgi:hypothetical protein